MAARASKSNNEKGWHASVPLLFIYKLLFVCGILSYTQTFWQISLFIFKLWSLGKRVRESHLSRLYRFDIECNYENLREMKIDFCYTYIYAWDRATELVWELEGLVEVC